MGSPIRIRCATSRGRTRRTASRLRRGPAPRRRAFGSSETVARFGVRETIELVRRFFYISGLCHIPRFAFPISPRTIPAPPGQGARPGVYAGQLAWFTYLLT